MEKLKLLNGFHLKMIAIITMLIDHTGAILLPQYFDLRIIGRLSFPIFCFLLVEGAMHTKDIKKYMIRLGAFAVISEVPFDIAFFRSLLHFQNQNVFFTLLIGVVAIWISKSLMKKSEEFVFGFEQGIVFGVAAVVAELLHCDYGAYGILIIGAMYAFHDKFYFMFGSYAVLTYFLSTGIQRYSTLALVPIGLYNGKRGPQIKILFYLFYPVHLLILIGIRYFIM